MTITNINPVSGSTVEVGALLSVTTTTSLQTIVYRRAGYSDESIFISGSGGFQVGYTGSSTANIWTFRRNTGWDVSPFQIIIDDGATETTIEYYIVSAGEYPVHMRPWGSGGGSSGTGTVAKLNDIGDVNVPAPDDLDVVSWDDATQKWISRAPSTPGAHNLDSHSDVTIINPQDTEVLKFNGAIWVNAPGGDGQSGLGLWEFDSATTAAGIGAGQFRINGIGFEIYVSVRSKNGLDLSYIFLQLDTWGLSFLKSGGSSEGGYVGINSVTDNGTYFTFGLSTISTTGTFTDGDTFNFSLAPTGPITGDANVSNGGLLFELESVAGASPSGPAKFTTNAENINSITSLKFSDNTFNGQSDVSLFMAGIPVGSKILLTEQPGSGSSAKNTTGTVTSVINGAGFTTVAFTNDAAAFSATMVPGEKYELFVMPLGGGGNLNGNDFYTEIGQWTLDDADSTPDVGEWYIAGATSMQAASQTFIVNQSDQVGYHRNYLLDLLEPGDSLYLATPSGANGSILFTVTSNSGDVSGRYTLGLDYVSGGVGTTWNTYSTTVFSFVLKKAGVVHNLSATAAPAFGDDDLDGYTVGSRWIDVTNDDEYVCVDNSTAAAIWRKTSVKIGGVGEWEYVSGGGTPITGQWTENASGVPANITSIAVSFRDNTNLDLTALQNLMDSANAGVLVLRDEHNKWYGTYSISNVTVSAGVYTYTVAAVDVVGGPIAGQQTRIWMVPYAALGGGATTLAALTDTTISTPATNDVLVYDAGTGKWNNAAGVSHWTIGSAATYPGPVNVSTGTLWVDDNFPTKLFYRDDDAVDHDLLALSGGGTGDVSFSTGAVVDGQIAVHGADGQTLKGGTDVPIVDTANNDITLKTLTASDGGTEKTEYAEYGIGPYASRTTDFTIGGVQQASPVDIGVYGMSSSGANNGGDLNLSGGGSVSGQLGRIVMQGREINIQAPIVTNSTVDGVDVAADAAKLVNVASPVTTTAAALLDDTSPGAMRSTLGLGGAAVLNVGTTTGTVADGGVAYANTTSVSSLSTNKADKATILGAGTGLTGGGDLSTNRSFAVNVGTLANQIVQLDGTAKLPAVDGSQLLNVPGAVSTDEYNAIHDANTPSASNVFLTENDFGTVTALNTLLTDGPISAFIVVPDPDALPTAAIENRYAWRESDGTLHRDNGAVAGTWTQVGGNLPIDSDDIDAITGAASPSASNLFATMADVVALATFPAADSGDKAALDAAISDALILSNLAGEFTAAFLVDGGGENTTLADADRILVERGTDGVKEYAQLGNVRGVYAEEDGVAVAGGPFTTIDVKDALSVVAAGRTLEITIPPPGTGGGGSGNTVGIGQWSFSNSGSSTPAAGGLTSSAGAAKNTAFLYAHTNPVVPNVAAHAQKSFDSVVVGDGLLIQNAASPGTEGALYNVVAMLRTGDVTRFTVTASPITFGGTDYVNGDAYSINIIRSGGATISDRYSSSTTTTATGTLESFGGGAILAGGKYKLSFTGEVSHSVPGATMTFTFDETGPPTYTPVVLFTKVITAPDAADTSDLANMQRSVAFNAIVTISASQVNQALKWVTSSGTGTLHSYEFLVEKVGA